MKEVQDNLNLEEPRLDYVPQGFNEKSIPDYVLEDINISLEQADRGELIPFDEVLAHLR